MQVVYGRVARGAVLQQLREHLRRNLVRFGRTWHCQARGIPQARRTAPSRFPARPFRLCAPCHRSALTSILRMHAGAPCVRSGTRPWCSSLTCRQGGAIQRLHMHACMHACLKHGQQVCFS